MLSSSWDVIYASKICKCHHDKMIDVYEFLQIVRGLRYRGHDLTPDNLTSYLAPSQLRGREVRLPGRLEDSLVLGSVLCSGDDEYPAIGPDLAAPASMINPEPPTYCLRFCPVPGYHHLLGLANEDGRVAIQDTSKVQE